MKLYFFENEREMDLYVVLAKSQKDAIRQMREELADFGFKLSQWTITEYDLDSGPIRYAMCAED